MPARYIDLTYAEASPVGGKPGQAGAVSREPRNTAATRGRRPREHSKSWSADGVGLGSRLTRRGWAGAETGVAGEAGWGGAPPGGEGRRQWPGRGRGASG